jgi:hypothetical protein
MTEFWLLLQLLEMWEELMMQIVLFAGNFGLIIMFWSTPSVTSVFISIPHNAAISFCLSFLSLRMPLNIIRAWNFYKEAHCRAARQGVGQGPSVRLSVCLSVRPSIYSFVCLFVRLSVRSSVRSSVCPFVCPNVFFSLSLKLSVRLSLKIRDRKNRFVCIYVCIFREKEIRLQTTYAQQTEALLSQRSGRRHRSVFRFFSR